MPVTIALPASAGAPAGLISCNPATARSGDMRPRSTLSTCPAPAGPTGQRVFPAPTRRRFARSGRHRALLQPWRRPAATCCANR